jgi:hypothetical protein
LPHVRWLPTLTKDKVEVGIFKLSFDRAMWWHDCVQPVINAEQSPRADQGWRWPLYVTLLKGLAATLGQKPHAYEISVLKPDFSHVPCALVLMVGRYAALDGTGKAPFLWFFSNAPAAALKPYLSESEIPKPIAVSALDSAVTHAFRFGALGRISLHAASKGGDKLMAWYEGHGMDKFPSTRKHPALGRGYDEADGRYFFYMTAGACTFASRQDSFR